MTRRTGVDVAYERIRAAIVENRFGPGQRLIEQRIAEEFSLSRTPVREALRRLEAEGLVVSERNRGAVVRPISVDEVVDLYELRSRLESYAAELAATRRTDDELHALRSAADDFGRARSGARGAGVHGVRRLNEANRALHQAIVTAAHHERLAAMLRRTVDIPLVFQAFRSFDDAERQRSDLFHRLIVDAIARGEAQRAARLMSEHISQGRDVVVDGMRAAGSRDHSVATDANLRRTGPTP